jgi:hypothetical protein
MVYDGSKVESTEGFGQGDIKAPFGCCLGTAKCGQDALEPLIAGGKEWTAVSIMDDNTRCGEEFDVCASINHTIKSGPSFGEFINLSKTLVIPLTVFKKGATVPPAPSNLHPGVVRVTGGEGVEVGKAEGQRLLGSPLGFKEYCLQYVREHNKKKYKPFYEKLKTIKHPHVVYHLMNRYSLAAGFIFLYRTTPPWTVVHTGGS